jgi:hypothetical protein
MLLLYRQISGRNQTKAKALDLDFEYDRLHPKKPQPNDLSEVQAERAYQCPATGQRPLFLLWREISASRHQRLWGPGCQSVAACCQRSGGADVFI